MTKTSYLLYELIFHKNVEKNVEKSGFLEKLYLLF